MLPQLSLSQLKLLCNSIMCPLDGCSPCLCLISLPCLRFHLMLQLHDLVLLFLQLTCCLFELNIGSLELLFQQLQSCLAVLVCWLLLL